MPGMIKPMLAKLIDKPFDSDDWLFEIKWDGYRALANIKKGKVKLYSRNGLEFFKYTQVVEELQKIPFDAIFDGEVVALDENGIPRFQYLQNFDSDPSRQLQYNVFDIIYFDGHDLSGVPLIKRKELLQQILPENDIIKYSDHITGSGKDFFHEVEKQGLEGIVGKKTDSPYRFNKRSGEWVKIKTSLRQEAIICGYTDPKGGRKYFGSLVLGVYDEDNKLQWIGSSGGGFNDKSLIEIYDKLQDIRQEKSPFPIKISARSKVHWVKPKLVCEVSFSEWTGEGSMRHPVFQGLREDKDPKDVKREKEKKTEKVIEEASDLPDPPVKKKVSAPKKANGGTTLKINGVTLQISNPDKILWPDDGITKGELINYYRSVAPFILSHLKGRPQSQHRFPNGIYGNRFYKKNMEDIPEWASSVKVPSESHGGWINYLVCNDEQTLVYMANLACIELNPWSSKIGSLEYPDWIVIDLDPGESNTFEQVIEAALAVKEVLDKAKIKAYPKTSGSSGIHIYIPMGAQYTYEEGKIFANVIAEMAQHLLPATTSTIRNTQKRGDKIYIDYLQNIMGQTLACVYSARPKPGATVSTPLKWEEVKSGLHPSDFTIKNAPARFKKLGDIFRPVLTEKLDIAKSLKLLSK
jgi:bifunctional non-homologous end joining protein LigD